MDAPESQEALEWMRKRYWEDRTWAEPLLTDRSWGYSIYANGYVAMIEDGGPWFALARDVKGIYDIDFFHPPQGPVRRSSYLVTDGYGMWQNTKYVDASWEVLRHLAGPINQEIRMRNGGRMAVRMSTVQKYEEAIIDLEPSMADMNLDVVLEAFEMAYGTDDERFFCQAEAEEIINPLPEKVFIIGDSPVSILADACPQVEASQTCEAI